VGENNWEEVDAGDLLGKNLGWPICEGACSPSDARFVDPIFQYPNATSPPATTGCALIGGYVVLDAALTGLTGRYLYGDRCRDDLRTLDLAVQGADPRPAGVSIPAVDALLGFGEDSRGCVYVLTEQNAYRLAPDAGASKECTEPPPQPPPIGSGLAASETPGTPPAAPGATSPDTRRRA
jgi:hypothetical protein